MKASKMRVNKDVNKDAKKRAKKKKSAASRLPPTHVFLELDENDRQVKNEIQFGKIVTIQFEPKIHICSEEQMYELREREMVKKWLMELNKPENEITPEDSARCGKMSKRGTWFGRKDDNLYKISSISLVDFQNRVVQINWANYQMQRYEWMKLPTAAAEPEGAEDAAGENDVAREDVEGVGGDHEEREEENMEDIPESSEKPVEEIGGDHEEREDESMEDAPEGNEKPAEESIEDVPKDGHDELDDQHVAPCTSSPRKRHQQEEELFTVEGEGSAEKKARTDSSESKNVPDVEEYPAPPQVPVVIEKITVVRAEVQWENETLYTERQKAEREKTLNAHHFGQEGFESEFDISL